MTDVRLGQVRPTRMRRIGARHMLVLPQQQAQVLSLDDIETKLRQARQQRAQLQQQIGRLDAFLADLEQQVATFKALPIERDEDDPEVPQPEHERVGARLPELERIGARLPRDARPPQHLASVTPVGFGVVPEGATPVPPPELTAADG
jgi:hypothetical protein